MLILETQRLILRQIEADDLPDLHRMFSDSITMSFWPSPFSLEATRNWINRSRESYHTYGFGRYAVILKEADLLIGDCGIMRSEIDGQLENDLGYILFHAFWKHGYATEAAEACTRYGFDTLHLSRICANMPVDHIASRRVAENIGMTLEQEFHNQRNRNIPTCLYAIDRPRHDERRH